MVENRGAAALAGAFALVAAASTMETAFAACSGFYERTLECHGQLARSEARGLEPARLRVDWDAEFRNNDVYLRIGAEPQQVFAERFLKGCSGPQEFPVRVFYDGRIASPDSRLRCEISLRVPEWSDDGKVTSALVTCNGQGFYSLDCKEIGG